LILSSSSGVNLVPYSNLACVIKPNVMKLHTKQGEMSKVDESDCQDSAGDCMINLMMDNLYGVP
jgi:hypothetical protein